MLSEPGAPVAEGTIPLSVPALRGNEWKYVKECLDSNWVSSAGPFVGRFERMVAGFVGTKYAVSTQNGTAALHVALLVAGIQPEDEVLVSTLTFIAPANAVRYCGAWPVLIDAEPTYWQMDPQRVIDFLERDCDCASGRLRNRATGRRVRAILPVHILGHPVDMDPILELAARYRLLVIEDASESLGVKYKGQMTGSLGDMACFSFNGNKIATTGGGGMIVTNNEEWARKARHLTTQAKVDEIEYVHDQVGYNYRLTNIQAALGCAQLEQLPGFISAKRHIAELYLDHLSRRPGIIPLKEPPWGTSTYWLFTVRLASTPRSSRPVMHGLAGEGIQTRPLWQPIHMSPCYRGQHTEHLPVAEGLYRECLSLPCSSASTEREISIVADALLKWSG
jgi:perosamine synthetase